ncbi:MULTISPECIES: hypothetical protein [Brevibacillus]|uniref:hypothetical protein n=1 Tax=Brevibacillus TaxID=55080 RepID=UPI001E36A076|nr:MULTISPECIES: hypothetical protein [Brevibacillus]MCE0450387.1 hypothetical protein [Brevibacillus sp. AF8]MCM3145992.1 hypothetical protein [Brevibacillus sp. MER 51]UKK97025.1 hypothetical protein FO446_06175 [Brevibacillus brevis]
MKKVLLALTLVFAVSSSAFAASSETEPNNTFETADSFTINTSISGTTDFDDRDYFVFQANKTGKVRVTLTHTNDKGAPAFQVYEQDRTKIGTSDYSTPMEINVVAGKNYYVQVLGIIGYPSYTVSAENL